MRRSLMIVFVLCLPVNTVVINQSISQSMTYQIAFLRRSGFSPMSVIYRKITWFTDQLPLQTDVDSIPTWCSTWLMLLNNSKTKLMSFTNHAFRIQTSYSLNNTTVELANTKKCLGLDLHPDLTWNHPINIIFAYANRSLGFLKHRLKYGPSNLRKLA